MGGIQNPESGIRATSPLRCACLMLLAMPLAGCGAFLGLDARPVARIELQVQAEGRRVAGAVVQVLNYGRKVAQGATDERGRIDLDGEIDRAAPSTARSLFPWISVRVEKADFTTLDLSFTVEDFVEEGNRHRLTRGVAMRRAS